MLKYRMRGLFYSILLISAFSSPAPAVSDAASEAEMFFRQGKWDRAIKAYCALTAENPTVENLVRLGDACLYGGEYKASRDAFLKAAKREENRESAVSLALLDALKDKKKLDSLVPFLDSDGGSARPWRSAGIYYTLMDHDDKAIYYFSEAIERDPEDYMSFFHIGQAYEEHFQFDEAIKFYKEAVEINPEFAAALNNLGYCYKEKQYWTYAIEMYNKAIAVDPENSGYHYNVGNAYAKKHMLEEAFVSYKKALALDPAFAKAHYNMARTYKKMGNLEEAVKEMKLYVKYWRKDISELDAPPRDVAKRMIEELEDAIEWEKSGKK